MAEATTVTVSGAGDDFFRAYSLLSAGTPAPDPVTRVLVFNPGFGRDQIQVDRSTYSWPIGSQDQQREPYVIRLGEGLTPDDVQVVMREDVYVPAAGYVYESGWNVTWELTVRHATDSILITDFFPAGTTKPADLHAAPRSLVQIEFANGTVWSAAQVQALLNQPLQPPGPIFGTSGDDLIEPGKGNHLIDLGAGDGRDTVVAWRGDGDDTVRGPLDVLRLKGGIQQGELQFSGTSKVVVIEKGRVAYSLSADTLNSIELDDGTVLGLSGIQQASFAGSLLNDLIVGTAGDDLLRGREGNDTLLGGAGNDTLLGEDSLVGYGGSNLLDGGAGNDTLVSRGLNDTLIGGAGTDTFVIRPLGSARIFDDLSGDGADTVVFEQSTLDVSFSFQDNTLRVNSVSQGKPIAIIENYLGASLAETSVASLRFADGQVLDAAAIYQRALQTWTGNDYVQGSSLSDVIDGMAGNDQLWGGGGRDTLIGGTGHDYLTGGAGDDVIRYARGDGFDVILSNDDAAGDVVELGAGIAASDFVVVESTYDASRFSLQLLLKDGSGGLQLMNSAADGLGGLNDARDLASVKLANGTVLKGLDLYGRRVANEGTTGADTLWAYGGHGTLAGGNGNDVLNGYLTDDYLDGGLGKDTLRGGLGDDWLVGDKGNDTYLFNRGEGHDTIIDIDGTWFNSDLLKVGGATSKQLWFTQAGNNLDISVIGTDDKVTVYDWFVSSVNRVEKITASDGKSLSASKVQALVNTMASFSPPVAGQTTLPADTPSSVTKVIASSWT